MAQPAVHPPAAAEQANGAANSDTHGMGFKMLGDFECEAPAPAPAAAAPAAAAPVPAARQEIAEADLPPGRQGERFGAQPAPNTNILLVSSPVSPQVALTASGYGTRRIRAEKAQNWEWGILNPEMEFREELLHFNFSYLIDPRQVYLGRTKNHNLVVVAQVVKKSGHKSRKTRRGGTTPPSSLSGICASPLSGLASRSRGRKVNGDNRGKTKCSGIRRRAGMRKFVCFVLFWWVVPPSCPPGHIYSRLCFLFLAKSFFFHFSSE